MRSAHTIADFHAALRSGNRRTCYHIVSGLRRNGMSSLELYDTVLIPALVATGEEWHANEVSILEEHIATSIIRDIIAWDAVSSQPQEPRHGTVLIGGVPEEQHALAALMLGNLLEQAGWSVRSYGSGIPAEDLLAGLDLYRPDILFLTMKLHARLEETAELLLSVKAAYPDLGIVVGGTTAPFVRAVLEPFVYGFADTLVHGIELAKSWSNAHPQPAR